MDETRSLRSPEGRPPTDGQPGYFWHRVEAADSESKQPWFAAAFHLRQLLAAKEADAVQWQQRRQGCAEKLRQP